MLINKRLLILFLLSFLNVLAEAQVAVTPTIDPVFFRFNDPITITYDVTGTSLSSLTNAYAWVWVPGIGDSKYNINPANTNATTDNAKFTKSVVNGKTLFSLTFTPASFFNQNISSAATLGFLLKGNNWTDGQSTDYFASFWNGTFELKLNSPQQQPLFVSNGQVVNISASTPIAADFELRINDIVVDQQNNLLEYSFEYTVEDLITSYTVLLTASAGSSESEKSFQLLLTQVSEIVTRPTGIIPGINYHDSDEKVTLCLWAPGKSSVYVRGDFHECDWNILPQYLMKRDGEYFWIELEDLEPGKEYAFQYLVDQSIWIADPYADKILDPDDQFIPLATYPNLKPYPAKARQSMWYNNRLSVFQTGQVPYVWKAENYEPPAKEKLVIYELLVRDYFGNGNQNFQTLIDTLGYLKKLGVNAIELMPVMEFNGNDSWGYNPTFLFAVDKFYGTKYKFKEFVDKCHELNIAVILDIAMNHHDIPNPYVMMDFDFNAFRPTSNNKWFNVTARHPFNVFFDMNHESAYTKTYLDTVNYHWLNEYKIDGFRFDLSKGFTQSNNPNNVDAWSSYDASRVTILKRMADRIWDYFPDAYVILEHFAVNSEERELAEYRAAEGKGMLQWGNLNHAYAQNAMGYSSGSDISWVYHGARGYSVPHVIGYMESHDEQRMMYRNQQFGRTVEGYNIKDTETGLSRIRATSTMFYTIPGPKMLWQFGEMGYDISIDDGGRTSPKPVKWEYLNDFSRQRLLEHTSDLMRLRSTYNIFTEGSATISGGTDLVKQITLKNSPYTTTPTQISSMNAQLVANFDVTPRTIQVNFPHTGEWYDYYAYGKPVSVASTPYTMELGPGSYKLFTDVQITNPVVTSISEEAIEKVYLYPNPADDILFIGGDSEVRSLQLVSMQGKAVNPIQNSARSWYIGDLPAGLYIVDVRMNGKSIKLKMIKR